MQVYHFCYIYIFICMYVCIISTAVFVNGETLEQMSEVCISKPENK
jgi:hypothetical protein